MYFGDSLGSIRWEICGVGFAVYLLEVYLQSLLLDYSSGIFSSKRPLPIDVTNDIYILYSGLYSSVH